MRLTWHIVRKDLRRMALPVAAWVAFVAVVAIWFGAMHMPADAIAAHEVNRWAWGVGAFTTWVVAMQVVTGVLLAAHLMLDDAVVGTTAFWQTRPIGRGRMLGAKLIAGGLLLVAAPTLVLVPVWLVHGFSVGELARAAVEFAGWQVAIVVLAFGFASLSKSLAQFFFAAVGVAVAFVIAAAPFGVIWWGTKLSDAVEISRQFLVLLLPVPFMALVLVAQHGWRRTRLGWLAIGAGVVVVHLVRVTWPFDLTKQIPAMWHRDWPAARGDDATREIAVKKIITPIDRGLPYSVRLEVGGGPVAGGFLAPHQATGAVHWAKGATAPIWLSHGGFWGEDAALRVAGLRHDQGPMEWDMTGRMAAGGDLQSKPGEAEFRGQMQLLWVHGRVLAELPWRAGAEASSGSSSIRIVGLGDEFNYDRPCVVVEERDSLRLRDLGLTAGLSVRQMDDSRQDCYLLVNRALGVFKCLHIVELGSVNLSSLLVSARQLEYSFPQKIENGKPIELPGWRDGAVLIKVRFERERRVTREIAGGKVALVAEEEKK